MGYDALKARLLGIGNPRDRALLCTVYGGMARVIVLGHA